MLPEPELSLAVARSRIAWILDHPDTSCWLKDAVRSACLRDPVAVQNDVEMLRHLILPYATAQIKLSLDKVSVAQSSI